MNVWQHKANTFADQIAIKAMWIYHVINLLVGMYTFTCVCIYIYVLKYWLMPLLLPFCFERQGPVWRVQQHNKILLLEVQEAVKHL